MFETERFNQFICTEAKKLREKDTPPKTLEEWQTRKKVLREKMFTAMGRFPEKDTPLESKLLGVVNREGFRVEKLILQTRPNVWMTASAYVPQLKENQKTPAVLVVHGHWAGARRDPVVQARCLGLVKLGFFVLAVDAFGAGERFTNPARGTYHGALYGTTLWPTGNTLLGMQVYDNRRAVDYLLTRPEVNGKLGITGASGGGNQTMYAGALDERFQAVVPVCSVGNYQAYLKSACCVCEVLPSALTFTEEGDVLGLVAPRALLVINASKDGIQFSPAEAEKSVSRAKAIFETLQVASKIRHMIFESPHAYNQQMREAMYGWMTLHLKGEGKGDPIPEPAHELEKLEDLACFPDPNDRPMGFLFPPTFAAAEGKALSAKASKLLPNHAEMWQANAILLRDDLKKLLGELPKVPQPKGAKLDALPPENKLEGVTTTAKSEGDLPIPMTIRGKTSKELFTGSMCILLNLEGRVASEKHPLLPALVAKGYTVVMPDLRGTGDTKLKADAVAGAIDHNSAEHALWIGRPMLAQWLADVGNVLDFLDTGIDKKPQPPLLIGLDHAGVIATLAGAIFTDRIRGVMTVKSMSSFISETPYASGTPMGLLFPGILQVGDIQHFAGLVAPKPMTIIDGFSANGRKLSEKELQEAYAFTKGVYQATKSSEKLTLAVDVKWDAVPLG